MALKYIDDYNRKDYYSSDNRKSNFDNQSEKYVGKLSHTLASLKNEHLPNG